MKTKKQFSKAVLILLFTLSTSVARAEWVAVAKLDQQIGLQDLKACDYRLVHANQGYGPYILNRVNIVERAADDFSFYSQTFHFSLDFEDVETLAIFREAIVPHLPGLPSVQDYIDRYTDPATRPFAEKITVYVDSEEPLRAEFTYRHTIDGGFFMNLDLPTWTLERNCLTKPIPPKKPKRPKGFPRH